MTVAIAHPKLVMTGLDLLACSSIFWYQTGYSIYVLRQASRRSWRIGQKNAVRVRFLTYAGTAQEGCLRLMGKKLLVSLAMEGKLHADGLQSMDEEDDVLTAMARELVTRQGVGEAAAEVWRSLQTGAREQTARLILGVPPGADLQEESPSEESVWLPPAGAPVQLSLF